MASVQEPCSVSLYKVEPNGNKTRLLKARVEQLAPAGGAPDGAPASVSTPEKLLFVNSPIVLKNDDILQVAVTADGADGVDVSDCIFSIPLATTSGTTVLSRADFANPAPADFTTVAGSEIVMGGYKITEGMARLSGKIYLDVQDDTA